ncbi:MAG: GerMN domain-containing protein [Lachnospiraceae bacterium]|nr:GerMN domain-containing protein [Lachnospiraceae bacterium]
MMFKRSLHIIIVISMFISAMLLVSCKEDAGDDAGDIVTVYDLSRDMSHIEPSDYKMTTQTDTDHIKELLQRVIDGPKGNRIRSAVPEEVTAVTYIVGPQTVMVNFDSSYNGIQQMRRILCEAAIVRTLCQLDNVYAVSFSVEGVPLFDSQNVPIGLLTPDSFVENEGNMINMYERADLRLYFASEDGQSLVEKVETITYNGNISTDRLVVDNIVLGPRGTDAFATVNPATIVNSVTTQDGVCYVNLSEDFLNKITNVTDKVMIYSIVNSLTELGNINKVQILIDGEMDVKLGEYDLSTLFERDLDMVD